MNPFEEAQRIERELLEAVRELEEQERRLEEDSRHIVENMEAARESTSPGESGPADSPSTGRGTVL